MRTGLDKAWDTPDSQEMIKSPPRLPLILPSPDLDSLVLPSGGPGSLSTVCWALLSHLPIGVQKPGDESSLGTLSFNGLPCHRMEG